MKILCAILLFVVCDIRAQEFELPETFATGGAVAAIGEFPSVVLIRTANTMPQPVCGGTIIDRQHVLTTARCVLNNQNRLVSPFWFSVTAGDVDIANPTSRREVRSVTRVYVHPQYQANTRRDDLAVLRVNAPFPDFSNVVEVAPRNTRFVRDGTSCRLGAWGAANNQAGAPIQPLMRSLTVPILSRVSCNVPAVHNNQVLDVHFCAGSIPATNPPSGACNGNIGSGLYCNGMLTGVLSFGVSCGAANNPGVYIDVSRYNDWINQQFSRTDNPTA